MKLVIFLLLAFSATTSYAQNTFPASGFVGLSNTTTAGLDISFREVNTAPDMVGLTWYSPVPGNYGLFRTYGYWNPPDYQQLEMSWITGIVLNPGSLYGKSYVDVKGSGLRVTSGSLGIGTTDTKGYKMAVNGSMIATVIKVKPYANWPDYVFEPQYPLMNIDSLSKFVTINKHLPGIPIAEQVDKEEIDVAAMSAKMLEKIEELTLYVVEQNKKIRELQQQLDSIKKQEGK